MQRHLGAEGGKDAKAVSGPVPVILITYATTEDAVRRARAAVKADQVISGEPQLIRIEKTDRTFVGVRAGLRPGKGTKMASTITVQPHQMLERVLSLEIVRVTERAAVSAARLRGHGKDKASDQAAVDAMRRELNKLPIDGTVVIGEGELDEAPMLFIGEQVGTKSGFKVDIAVDPLEGTTLCAKNMPGCDCDPGHGGCRHAKLHAPDCYMEKIAIGPGYPEGTIDLDASADENISQSCQGQGREAVRDHRDPARPSASRRYHCGRAQDRRGRQL